jgi:hypothetical protein
MIYWSGGQPGIDLNITAAVIANLAAGAYEIYSRCITPLDAPSRGTGTCFVRKLVANF